MKLAQTSLRAAAVSHKQVECSSWRIEMGRDAATRFLRVLVARGLHPDAPMADAAIRNIAIEAALDNEFDAARNYALQQG